MGLAYSENNVLILSQPMDASGPLASHFANIDKNDRTWFFFVIFVMPICILLLGLAVCMRVRRAQYLAAATRATEEREPLNAAAAAEASVGVAQAGTTTTTTTMVAGGMAPPPYTPSVYPSAPPAYQK
jgi:hypothetical protein